MHIFWRLVLAHFIADFTLQTNRVAGWKRASRLGMAVHILTHPVMMLLLTWHDAARPWVQARWFHLDGWVCIILITLFHWLEDEWRIWSIQRTGSPDSTAFFLWDQVVHIVMILAFSPTFSGTHAEPVILVALCVVLLAHFTSVLIYFIECDLWGKSVVLDKSKYRFIAERLLGASLFILPGVWFLLAGGWIGWVVYINYRQKNSRTWVHLVVGNAAVVLLGLMVRGLLLS